MTQDTEAGEAHLPDAVPNVVPDVVPDAVPDVVPDVVPDKNCGNPNCRTSCPHDSLKCWLCGFDFQTGELPAEDALIVDDTASGAIRAAATGGTTLPGQSVLAGDPEPNAEHASAQAPRPAIEPNVGRIAGAAMAGIGSTGLPPALLGADLTISSTDLDGTAAGGALLAAAGAQTITVIGEDESGEDLFAEAVSPSERRDLPPSDRTSQAGERTLPPVLTGTPTSSISPYAVEPSAISIPAFEVVHPPGPHIVILVDGEPRRSRPPTAAEPADCEPVVLPLDAEAVLFGRNQIEEATNAAICIDFDPYVGKIHGVFVRHANGMYSVRLLHPKNGLKVNGIHRSLGADIRLEHLDVITFGAWVKIIYYAHAPEEAEAPATAT